MNFFYNNNFFSDLEIQKYNGKSVEAYNLSMDLFDSSKLVLVFFIPTISSLNIKLRSNLKKNLFVLKKIKPKVFLILIKLINTSFSNNIFFKNLVLNVFKFFNVLNSNSFILIANDFSHFLYFEKFFFQYFLKYKINFFFLKIGIQYFFINSPYFKKIRLGLSNTNNNLCHLNFFFYFQYSFIKNFIFFFIFLKIQKDFFNKI